VFVTTHRRIGKLVHSYLKNHLKIELDPRALKYGCMKPDLPFSKIHFPHYKVDSFQDICEMINQLSISRDTFQNKKSLSVFSQNLGIILHYIADFFCEAHNFHLYDKIPKHLYYENILSSKFERIKVSDLKIMLKKFKNNNISAPKTTLKQYINDRHFEYLNMDRNFDTDLQFSLSMCINVAYSIINASAGSSNLIPGESSDVA